MGIVKTVYLDQCVVSNLAGDEPQDWRQTKIGAVPAEAVAKGAAEVWPRLHTCWTRSRALTRWVLWVGSMSQSTGRPTYTPP